MCNYKTPKNLEAIRTIQLLEADIEENRDDIGFDDSLDTTLKTQSWKKKKELISWTSLKLKISALWKHCQGNKIFPQVAEWGNIYKRHI